MAFLFDFEHAALFGFNGPVEFADYLLIFESEFDFEFAFDVEDVLLFLNKLVNHLVIKVVLLCIEEDVHLVSVRKEGYPLDSSDELI